MSSTGRDPIARGFDDATATGILKAALHCRTKGLKFAEAAKQGGVEPMSADECRTTAVALIGVSEELAALARGEAA